MHETTSVGVCALPHGLTVGEQEPRRLMTPVLAAGPEGRFMVPLRLAV